MSFGGYRKEAQTHTHAKRRFALLLLSLMLIVLATGIMTGYALQSNDSVAYKPNSYNVHVQNSVIAVNAVFVAWQPQLNSITLNMTNTSINPITDQISFSFINGTTPLGIAGFFNVNFTPSQILVQSYHIPLQLDTLVAGSTINIEA